MKPFTLISNNCWSNKIYEHLGVEYQSPIISIFFHPDDYLKLATRLRWYLSQPLSFVTESRHEIIRKFRLDRDDYPIAMLGDVEMQCLHYQTPAEVIEKWNRRLARVVPDDDRLFYKFSDEHDCTQAQLEAFDALPVKNKVCFTSKPMPHLKSAVYVPGGECVSFPDQTDWQRFDGPAWVIS